MASAGPRNPTTTASDTSVGTVAWGTPANAVSSNDTRTTAALNNSTSEYLKVTNFGFTIPTNAVITGVMVEVEKSRTAGSGTLADSSVRLVRKGTIIGINHSSQGTAWTGTDAYSTYGADGDLWGVPWVAAEINAFDFGVVFSAVETASLAATAGVDHVRVTVYYTEGYVSAPQVIDPKQIVLFGQYYPIVGQIKVSLATQFPPKVVTNSDYGRASNPVMSTYAVSDLRGGMGLWRYTQYLENGEIHPSESGMYWTGQNVNAFWKNAITLGPLATSITNPDATAATNVVNAIDSLNGTVIVLFGARLYNHSGSAWSALIDTLPAGTSDHVWFNARCFYAQGTAGYSYQTAPDAVATDVAASASNPGVRSWAVWDGKLWALDTAGKIWDSTTGNAASWTTTGPTLPIQDTGALTLVVYDDASGDEVLWALTPFGPWLYDAVNAKWVQSRFQHQYHRRLFSRRGLGAVYRGALYHQANERKLYKLNMLSGTIVVQEADVGLPDGVPSSYQGEVKCIVADNDLMFATLSDGRNSSINWLLLAYNGLGWHPIYVNTADNGTEMSALYISNNANGYRLYFHDTTVADTNIVQWVNLAHLTESPLVSTITTYAASGNIELPYYDGGAPEQTKTAQQFRIKIAGASANETVQVAYRINGSTGAYTNLGSAVVTTDEVAIPFGTNNVGLAFKSIQFRLTFVRGSTSTNAPKMEYFALDFVRHPEILRGYTLRLDLHEPYMGRSPAQMVDAIIAAAKSDLFGTFAWRDDADNTRSSLVQVLAFEGAEDTGHDTRSSYVLRLVEVGYN